MSCFPNNSALLIRHLCTAIVSPPRWWFTSPCQHAKMKVGFPVKNSSESRLNQGETEKKENAPQAVCVLPEILSLKKGE